MTEHSREGLERVRAKWWVTVSTGDLDGYLALFAEDAVWVTAELDEVAGREAIRAWLAPVFAQFDYELTVTVADVRVAGDLGIERARFVSRMTPKPVAVSREKLGDEPVEDDTEEVAEETADDAITAISVDETVATEHADTEDAVAEHEAPHEGRYLIYWRWYGDAGWLVHRYADVTGVG